MASDSHPSIVERSEYFTPDLCIGKPPNNVMATHGKVYVEFLMTVKSSRTYNDSISDDGKPKPLQKPKKLNF